MIFNSLSPCKRSRSSDAGYSPMDPDTAKVKLESAKQKCGREIHVFETLAASSEPNETFNCEEKDDFYEFTAEDYFRILAAKKEDKYLKTRKIREAEEAVRRSKMTKAVIRVRFPDNNTLEATFHPSEPIQNLFDLLMRVVSQPELPFYIYTTPPKKQIKDMGQDFYSAGFVPGAIVYFSYELPKGDDGTAASLNSFLQQEILSLKGLKSVNEQTEKPELAQSVAETVTGDPSQVLQERRAAEKKPAKPRWLKM